MPGITDGALTVDNFWWALLASLVVVALSRSSLRAAETFPELMRFRVVRLIAGA